MATYIFNGECPAGMKQAFIDAYEPQSNDKLRLVVETTSSYKKSGIYSATRDDASKPVVIDWGDGTIEQVNGDVSQKVHTYASVGTFNVVVENIKTYAASDKSYPWYQKVSQNQYTLKEVVAMPNSVTSIGDYAFYGCNGLTSVTISNSVTSIGDNAFQDCGGLTNVTIGNNVTSIGLNAFNECTNITSITIPSNVTSIGSAFWFTKKLTNVYIEKTMQQVTDMNYSNWFEHNGYSRTVTIFCTDGQLTVTVYSGPV